MPEYSYEIIILNFELTVLNGICLRLYRKQSGMMIDMSSLDSDTTNIFRLVLHHTIPQSKWQLWLSAKFSVETGLEHWQQTHQVIRGPYSCLSHSLPSNRGRWQHFVYRITFVHGMYCAHWPNNPFAGFVDSCVPLLKIHARSSALLASFLLLFRCVYALASQLLMLLAAVRIGRSVERTHSTLFSFNKRKEEIRAYNNNNQFLSFFGDRADWRRCRCVCVADVNISSASHRIALYRNANAWSINTSYHCNMKIIPI